MNKKLNWRENFDIGVKEFSKNCSRMYVESQNRPIRSCPIPAISIRSNEKRVWKDISSLDISMHRKSFNFWSRFLVNVCGRHSKWARDRSLEILALQNSVSFFHGLNSFENWTGLRRSRQRFFLTRMERLNFLQSRIVAHFSFSYGRRKLHRELARISTFKY